MSVNTIGGHQLKDMLGVASAYLEKNKKAIDALNVFPVPDGDTGVNMSLTLATASRRRGPVPAIPSEMWPTP